MGRQSKPSHQSCADLTGLVSAQKIHLLIMIMILTDSWGLQQWLNSPITTNTLKQK